MKLSTIGTASSLVASLLVSSLHPLCAEGGQDAAQDLTDWRTNVRDKLTGQAQVDAILKKAKEMLGRPVVKPRFQLEDDKIVGCSANNLPTLGLLKGLPLESIQGVPGKLDNLGGLKGLPLKRVVIMWNRNLRRIDGLRGMDLEYLDLHGSKHVGDKRCLEGLPLQHLCLREAGPIPDLRVLMGMPLTWLDISHHGRIDRSRSNVVDLTFLADLKLKELWIDYTCAADLRPLHEMPLEKLSMVRAHVTDLSPVAALPLKYLDMRETGVTSLWPLKKMKLETLLLTPSRILEGMEVIRKLSTLKKINNKSPEAFWAAQARQKKEMRSPETENVELSVLPALERVVIDGKFDDWDLSGGAFVCSNVKVYRDEASLWVHFMYDRGHIYMLARWKDGSPLDNPGKHGQDHAWEGDSLQWRLMASPGDMEHQRIAHVTSWRDREHKEILHIAYGNLLTGVGTGEEELNPTGAEQAFRKDEDGKGYTQEMRIPWPLLAKRGHAPGPGDRVEVTVQVHFLIPGGAKAPGAPEYAERPRTVIVARDLSKAPERGVERSHLFWYPHLWAAAKLEPEGEMQPRPVRMRGGREFKVTMVKGLPTVDWEELAKEEKK